MKEKSTITEKISHKEVGKVEAVKEPTKKSQEKTLELEKEVHDAESGEDKCETC